WDSSCSGRSPPRPARSPGTCCARFRARTTTTYRSGEPAAAHPRPTYLAHRGLAGRVPCPALAALGRRAGAAAGPPGTPLRPVRADPVARRCRRAAGPVRGAGTGPGAVHPPVRTPVVRPCLSADVVEQPVRLDRTRHASLAGQDGRRAMGPPADLGDA